MIITRTPLRISLGGGGTDLPSYYREAGHGFLIAAAISKHVYISLHENFDDDILLKYSQIERRKTVEEVEHPLIRECLRATGAWQGVEVTSMADIPAGTGLGSSGAFAVGLLKALRMRTNSDSGNLAIAEEACKIEIDCLKEPVGKQDQYIASLGGVREMTISQDGTVSIESLRLTNIARQRLEENLLLFFTGLSRSASETLLNERHADTPANVRRSLDLTRDIGHRTRDVLEAGDLDRFGELLTEQWDIKHQRQPSAIHEDVDRLIRRGIRGGARGGKLVGAGGGGFLLFYAEEKAGLRAAMMNEGLAEVPFQFDELGSTVIVTR